MIIYHELLEQRKLEFPKGKVISMAKQLDISDQSAEQFVQFYDKVCDEWDQYVDDEDMMHELIQENKIEKRYSLFFIAYQRSRGEGHGHDWSFVYASNYYDESDEDEAKRVAYHSNGIDVYHEALCECKAFKKSPEYTKKYAEIITDEPFNLAAAQEIAKDFEAAYLKCIADGHSTIYAEQYGSKVSFNYAHEFAHSCDLLIGAGIPIDDARNYAKKVTYYLEKGEYWDRAVVLTEATLLAEEENIDSNLFLLIYWKVYFNGKRPSFIGTGNEDEDAKMIANEILSGKFSMDKVKQVSLKHYHSGTKPVDLNDPSYVR